MHLKLRLRSAFVVIGMMGLMTACAETDPVGVSPIALEGGGTNDPNLERLLRAEGSTDSGSSGVVRRHRIFCRQGLNFSASFNHRNPEYGTQVSIAQNPSIPFVHEEIVRSSNLMMATLAQGPLRAGSSSVYLVRRPLGRHTVETLTENIETLGEAPLVAQSIEGRTFAPWGRSNDGAWVFVPVKHVSPTGRVIYHYSVRDLENASQPLGSIYLHPRLYTNLRLDRSTQLFSADFLDEARRRTFKVVARFDPNEGTLVPRSLKVLGSHFSDPETNDVALEELPNGRLLLTRFSARAQRLWFYEFDAEGLNPREWRVETDDMQYPFPASTLIRENDGAVRVVVVDRKSLRILSVVESQTGVTVLREDHRKVWSKDVYLSGLFPIPEERSFLLLGSSEFKAWGARWLPSDGRLVPIGMAYAAGPCTHPSLAPELYSLHGEIR